MNHVFWGPISCISALAEDQNPVPEWVYERQGFAYLTFVIADLSEVGKRLKEHGVKLASAEPVGVREGVFALYTQQVQKFSVIVFLRPCVH